MSYRKCTRCGKRKTTADYKLLETGPKVYSVECLVCLATPVAPGEPIKTTKELKAEARLLTLEQEYQRELATRILAKKSLIHYIMRFQPNYKAGWVHYDICERLERFMKDVEDGKSPRLMLFMPPRHGKSLIASNYFPSWVLGHHPEYEIIASSYAVSLPIGFSRQVRERVRQKAYQNIFPHTKIHPEAQSAEAWITTEAGGYLAAGVGGGITGKGAHIAVIDDPIKDAEEADSETTRDSIWNWYGSTLHTRVAPGGGILVIQTRWHDDDLSGRLLTQMKTLVDEGVDGEEIESWEIVSYPAIAEHDEYILLDKTVTEEAKPGARLLRKKGEALHEERYPLKALLKKKRSMQPRHWSALYQQNPVPDEGDFFRRDQFRFYNGEPNWEDMYTFMAWDLAIGQKQKNDWTVGMVGSYDHNGDVYIRGMVRGRWGTYEIVDMFLNTFQRYGPSVSGIESGQLEMAIMPVMKTAMTERKLSPSFDFDLTPITDKRIRARPLQGYMQQGRVYFPSGQPWVELAMFEMLRFPGGLHDDIVDAMAWLIRLVAKNNPPRPPRRGGKLKSWRAKLHEEQTVRSPMAA